MHLTGLADTSWHPASASRPGPPAPVPAPDPAGSGEAPAAPLADLILRGPERIALTGPNGAGKTTLLRAIAGCPAASGSAPSWPPCCWRSPRTRWLRLDRDAGLAEIDPL